MSQWLMCWRAQYAVLKLPCGYDVSLVVCNVTLGLTGDKYGEVAHLIWTMAMLDWLQPHSLGISFTMYLAAASILFGVLTPTHAVPFLHHGPLSEAPPPRSSEFSLALNMSGTIVPLSAVYIEDHGVLLRASDTHDPSPGTPGR